MAPLSSDEETVIALAADLQTRCNVLLSELTAFEQYLAILGKAKEVELRTFVSSIRAEAKSLSRIEGMEQRTYDQRLHMLRSSNVAFYAAVWTTAKLSCGVIAFFKRFQYEKLCDVSAVLEPAVSSQKDNGDEKRKKSGASVDIVADDGAEWVKISTITETRLLFEIARQGWERDLDESSESEDIMRASRQDSDSDHIEFAENDISILRAADELVQASRAVRIRYQHPHIRMVLPNISRGNVDEVDTVLDDIQALGIELQTADSLGSSDFLESTPLDQILPSLVLDEFARLTSTVNIDCTILLAIVSDLSNMQVEKAPGLHKAAKRQIEMEEEQNLLPTVLLPAMGARNLLCTKEAATRMRQIVMSIGTETERARTEFLFGDTPGSRECNDCLAAFATLSDHTIPDSWKLPIKVVETSSNPLTGLPLVAEAVGKELSELNQSVFFYGWQNNITTFTSNGTVVRRIQAIVEESLKPGDHEVMGPPVWLCRTSRSLRAKDKNRAQD